ncbi:Cation/H+ exchanger - like 7 [Theobroma cacao]|uniref:K(+)/H(+) antiporter, putative n=1 Tax=Theobroma cacao TaxID=3641 RepID=A0A061FKU7_THECC|nr:K(+)/H(+) antiporter, putative [Theobroma cacao]WRX11690.1 Cation/H+ exchanger - like 7 [Theobroma cacao]
MAINETIYPKLCILYERNMYSKGIWYGENPLDYFIPLAMFQIILFFILSRAVYFLLRPLKQPKVVCNVLTGLLLGPSVLGRYTTLMDNLYPAKEMLAVNTLCLFSNISFIFLITVKTDTRMIFRTARDDWSLGLLSILVPLGISYTLFNLLRDFLPGFQGGIAAFTVCGIMSTSFLSDVAYGMDELKLLTSELGQLAMSSAMINDLVGWAIVATLIMSSQTKSLSIEAMLSFAAFPIFALYAVRPTISWIIRTTPEGKQVDQLYVVATLLGAFAMGAISDAIGLSFLPGIIAMGLIVPNGPPLGAAIVEKSELIINEFFMPFFYLRLGRLANIVEIRDWKEFNALLLIIITGFLAKLLSVCLHSCFCKMRVRYVLLLSSMLNVKGVLKFIYFIRFLTKRRIDEQSFVLLILSNLTVTAIAMPLIEYFYKPHLRLETSLSAKLSTMSLHSTSSFGELRILLCIHNEDDVHGIITLLEASNPTPVSTICAYVVHLVELVGRATPLLAPYKKVGRNRTDRIMRAFTNYSKTSEQSVTVQPYTSIAPYKTMYENVCRLAQAKHVPLIIVPFHKSQVGEINASFRCFNVQTQAYAPCTVGILVQRGLSCVTCAEFSCNIAVLFVGGPDDREALALAARMSGHPRVQITVMRIIVRENVHQSELEQQLDDKLLTEFKAKTENYNFVQCLEVQVNNSVEILSWIRSLENKYDLVMVGKRQGSNLELEGDMATWIEHPELGVLGDMVASEDFRRGTVSVLVLQHCMVGETSKNRSSSQRRRYSIGSFSALLK